VVQGETLHDDAWSLSHGVASLVEAPCTLVGRGVMVSWMIPLVLRVSRDSGVGGSGEILHDKAWSLSHGDACLVEAPRTLVGRGIRVSW